MAPTLALPFEATNPTRTLSQGITKVLIGRQATTTVVADSGNQASTLDGGSIAGIVIGSIAGFLLILWIIRSCSNMGQPGTWGSTFEPEREKPVRSSAYADPHRHRSRSRHSHHSRSPRRIEVIQPVAYEQRGRSPRAPPAAYYGGRSSYDGRELRRSSDARRYSGY